MKHKRSAPPVTTGYDPRAIGLDSGKTTDGHLTGENLSDPGKLTRPVAPRPADPKAPDGISGDWQ